VQVGVGVCKRRVQWMKREEREQRKKRNKKECAPALNAYCNVHVSQGRVRASAYVVLGNPYLRPVSLARTGLDFADAPCFFVLPTGRRDNGSAHAQPPQNWLCRSTRSTGRALLAGYYGPALQLFVGRGTLGSLEQIDR